MEKLSSMPKNRGASPGGIWQAFPQTSFCRKQLYQRRFRLPGGDLLDQFSLYLLERYNGDQTKAAEVSMNLDHWNALARISHTLAAHLANHLAASRFVLPHRITLDMPWSSSPPGDQSITQPEPPECEISGLVSGYPDSQIEIEIRRLCDWIEADGTHRIR